MTRLPLLALLIVVFNASAFQNEPDGFRGLQWGTSITEIEAQFGPPTSGKESEMRRRIGDKLAIGEAELIDVLYFFSDGQFDSVMLKSTGFSNKKALIGAFRTQFGEGMKPNRYIDHYLWSGPITRIGLRCRSVGDECTVLIFSTIGAQKKEAARKSAAQKAKEDF